ncbi:CBS domain-containing protein [Pseudoblastomonas halimionae]|uniref:CBS domain-containing protein n=1 Tax=Alteriqipengyuania halimionae TaxID=1926630 RepID=A0A6I4U4E3_9SPHN|nr:CBS domain-containing protein [Alteriqipengyuania halimionae]MXP10828.1 CBS domain-containing protein [Alteriqipengyuania halimionae]
MQISHLLADRSVDDIIACTAQDSVRDAVARLAGKRIGAMPVLGSAEGEGVELLGVFSERDVIYRLAEEGSPCLDRPVASVMSAPAITATPDMTVDEAQGLMTRRRIRHLPVVDGRELSGFISIGDLVKSKIGEVESEAEAMRSYIQSS